MDVSFFQFCPPNAQEKSRCRIEWNWVFVSLAVLTIATALIIKNEYFPHLAGERTLKPFMVRVKRMVDAKAPLFFYRSFDYGAIFYAERHVPSYTENSGQLPSPLFLLMWEEEWERIRARREVKVLDISEGKGPVGKHRLLLAEVEENSSLP